MDKQKLTVKINSEGIDELQRRINGLKETMEQLGKTAEETAAKINKINEFGIKIDMNIE